MIEIKSWNISGSEGRTVEINHKFYNASNLHLYNAGRELRHGSDYTITQLGSKEKSLIKVDVTNTGIEGRVTLEWDDKKPKTQYKEFTINSISDVEYYIDGFKGAVQNANEGVKEVLAKPTFNQLTPFNLPAPSTPSPNAMALPAFSQDTKLKGAATDGSVHIRFLQGITPLKESDNFTYGTNHPDLRWEIKSNEAEQEPTEEPSSEYECNTITNLLQNPNLDNPNKEELHMGMAASFYDLLRRGSKEGEGLFLPERASDEAAINALWQEYEKASYPLKIRSYEEFKAAIISLIPYRHCFSYKTPI